MGFVVLHLEKASGADSAMSAHIERTVQPKNADESRSYLNRELMIFPQGVENRTQAIQHRLDNANLTRKISKNQVKAIRVLLSATHEDMKSIEDFGNLKHWCKDNIDWLQDTFGKENLVSAVLHMDEKTPHIHATIVPIVSGERRKAKQESENATKRKYKKKDKSRNRLCADDIMNRPKLKEYQNTYAEKMRSYGLNRGVDGSEAKHISTAEYYRDLFYQKDSLQERVESLTYQIEEAKGKVYNIYEQRDEVKAEFIDTDAELRLKKKELALFESKLQQAEEAFKPFEKQDELNKVYSFFPKIKDYIDIANLAEQIGLKFDHIKSLIQGKSLTAKAYTFYSPEHKKEFEAKDVRLKIENNSDSKPFLSLGGKNILEWFREKFKELATDSKINNQKKGLRF